MDLRLNDGSGNICNANLVNCPPPWFLISMYSLHTESGNYYPLRLCWICRLFMTAPDAGFCTVPPDSPVA